MQVTNMGLESHIEGTVYDGEEASEAGAWGS